METFFSKQPDFTGMILLVYSTRDIAGRNIAKQIFNHVDFTKTGIIFQDNPVYSATINQQKVTFATLTEEAVNSQNLPESFPNHNLIIFLSRHSSQSGKPTLSVHTPGNYSKAELGGLPKNLSVSPANAMHAVLKALSRKKLERQLNYEVSYECTHHGPSLDVPTMFVELGSSPEQWNDLDAADAVAQATVEAIINLHSYNSPAVLGIGGTHYNQKFTNMALNDEAVFGHIIPKYAITQIDTELLNQCIQKTLEKIEYAILDWKGIRSQDKPNLLAALNETSLPIKKV
jgi:D-aminoacyl-tRNA deacylase